MVAFFALWLAAVGAAWGGDAAAPPDASTVLRFRTDAGPRVDPVFGDIGTLRTAVDRFLSLQAEMDQVREEFSSAVHETLEALRSPRPGTTVRQCPVGTAAPYARALASGARYLALGQRLQARYREIRRSDELGDTVGLTPDYRWKVKRAKDLYLQLLGDYREMRVAFYDQLGAELRHARCKLASRAPVTATKPGEGPPNPSDPGAWQLEAAKPETGAPSPRGPVVAPKGDEMSSVAVESALAAASAIWIDIDNTLCLQPTRVAIDGQPAGDVPGGKKTSVRTRAGPHELCVLPATDARTCGAPGTLRRAYLHEGWTLTVHCNR